VLQDLEHQILPPQSGGVFDAEPEGNLVQLGDVHFLQFVQVKRRRLFTLFAWFACSSSHEFLAEERDLLFEREKDAVPQGGHAFSGLGRERKRGIEIPLNRAERAVTISSDRPSEKTRGKERLWRAFVF
jgi:hypothetical protein